MNTLFDEFKKDKIVLENKIIDLLNDFESKYGNYFISREIILDRYNGSNHADGKIWKVDIKLIL